MAMITKNLRLFALACLTSIPVLSAADVLVDNFNDGNYVAETVNNSLWQGNVTDPSVSPPTGRGLAWRSGLSGGVYLIPFTSTKDAQLSGTAGNYEYFYGTAPAPLRGSAVNGADTATGAERRLQYIGLSLSTTATATVDWSAYRYLRYTAWRTASPNPADPGGARQWQHVVSMSSPGSCFVSGANVPNTSTGPWDASGTNLVGFPLTTTPQVFVLDLTSATQFKIDPIYQNMWTFAPLPFPALCSPGPTNVNLSQVTGLFIGIRRFGANTQPSGAGGALDANFTVDDIILMQNAPAINAVPTSSTVVDRFDTREIQISLAAMPSHPVTVTASSDNPLRMTVLSPASVTFTQADWNTTKTVTVQAQNDLGSSSISFTRTTSDLLYANPANAPAPTLPFSTVPVTVSKFEIGG